MAVRIALSDEAFDAALRQGQLASMAELTADLPSADPPKPPSAPSSAAADQARSDQTRPDQDAGSPDASAPGGPAPEARDAQNQDAQAQDAQAQDAQAQDAQAQDAQAQDAQAQDAQAQDALATDALAPDGSEQAAASPARPGKQKAAARPRAGPVGAANGSAGMLRIRTLGGAVVEIGDTALTAADWSYAKPRELMFLLASSPPMTKDQIASALWPDLARQQLGNALHTALRELRRALGDAGWVRYADGNYRFDRSRPHECDVTVFEDALVAARRARPAEAALPELQRAIAVYGGDFLDGMSTGEWALVRRDELRRAFESALLATGRLQVAGGRHQAAAASFRKAVAHEPLNESAHRELMTCWARLGETARAVRHYEELAGVLREQVGVAPAAETEALYRRLLTAK
jgi:DNA-binding SARP family transcriptional activator